MYVKEQISIWSEGSQIAANNRGSERFSQGFSCAPFMDEGLSRCWYQNQIPIIIMSAGSWWLSNSLNQELSVTTRKGKYLSWTINIDKARSLTFDNICICTQSSNKRPSKNKRDVSSFLAKGSRGNVYGVLNCRLTAHAANRTFTCMNNMTLNSKWFYKALNLK